MRRPAALLAGCATVLALLPAAGHGATRTVEEPPARSVTTAEPSARQAGVSARQRTTRRTTYRAPRWLTPPRVRAAGWAVTDLDTGRLLAVHRPRTARQPASTLKLLTALTAVRTVPIDPPHRVTRTEARATCVCVGLRPGRRYGRGSLLDALLLPSANDAAQALAGAHPRGRRGFLRAMNRRASSLGLTSTRAVNPHGLTAPGNGTSPRDLLVLLRAAQSTRGVEKHLRRPSARFGPVGGPKETITRTNAYLERYPRAQGKTGFTTAAGYNLVIAVPLRTGPREQGRVRLIGAATMGSPTREASVRANRRLSEWVARHHRALRPVGRLPKAPGPVVGKHARWVR
ncbi:hypothetical protein KLP28_01420 [Nocardioidaceae bacterium]|nr:hypothetical protein KLP28_01420 [Nocardioidaceae bacterium]